MYKIIGADLKEYGPVSAEQLRQWITEGRVNGQTKAQAAGETEWKTVADLAEFADAFPKTPAPVYPPAIPITPLPAQRRTSALAVWSMITGILSLFCCCSLVLGPVAVVLGAVALSHFKTHPELNGRGFAITGIVLGVFAFLIWVVVSAVYFSSPEFMQVWHKAMEQQQ